MTSQERLLDPSWALTSHWCCGIRRQSPLGCRPARPWRRRPASGWRARSSRTARPRPRTLAERLGLTAGRRTPAPRPPGRRTAVVRGRTAKPRQPGAGAARRRLFALTESGPRPLRPAVRRPGRPGAALPGRDRRRTTPSSSSRAVGWRSSSVTTTGSSRTRPRARAPAEALARVFTDEGYAASVDATLPVYRRPAVPAALPGVPRGPRVPAAVRGRDRGDRPGARHARRSPGHDRPRRRCLHHLHPRPTPQARPSPTTTGRGRPHDDASTSATPGSKASAATSSAGTTADAAGAGAQRGLNEAVVRDISGRRASPRGCSTCASRACGSSTRSRCRPGAPTSSGIDFDNIKYFVRSSEKQATVVGGPSRGHQEHLRQARHPRGREAAPRRRRRGAVRVRGRLPLDPRGPRGAGRALPRHRHRATEHQELFKEYFGTVIPVGDNKFAALNTSVWSGGSFIYVPPGVHVDIPLQAYFRINTENMGQFERTLIIVDEGAYVHYVEGCTAPIYSSDSLHSAVVEIIVKKGGRCRYTTIQNWSNNVYNLVTKRAVCAGRRHHGVGRRQHRLQGDDEVPRRLPDGRARQGRDAVDRLRGRGPAPGRRRQDGPRRAEHLVSSILSKSVARGGGRTSYRGLVQINEGAHGSKSNVLCDALLVDQISRSDTYPTSTSARTTCRWATRRASPRSARTSCST